VVHVTEEGLEGQEQDQLEHHPHRPGHDHSQRHIHPPPSPDRPHKRQQHKRSPCGQGEVSQAQLCRLHVESLHVRGVEPYPDRLVVQIPDGPQVAVLRSRRRSLELIEDEPCVEWIEPVADHRGEVGGIHSPAPQAL